MADRWIDRHPQNRRRWAPVVTGILLTVTIVFLITTLRKPRVGPGPAAGKALVEERSDVMISTGSIGAGGSLSRSLESQGFSPADVTAIEKSLKPVFNVRFAKSEDIFEVHRTTAGNFLKLRYRPNRFVSYVVQPSSGGALVASLQKEPLHETLVGASGELKTSLWDAMSEQGVPPEIIYRFAEIFSWRFDFLTEPRQGDSYKIVWKRAVGAEAMRDGEIVAAVYTSKDKGTLNAFPLAGDYYDSEGESLRGEFLRAPLAFRRISSRFTERRYHPILRYWRPHHGIDYSAARGTPVVSIADGLVIDKGYKGGLGNEVHVRHAGSYVSIYGHLMGYAKGVRIGSHVKQGQVIGYVGSTGLSTGPHLHFGFEQGGKFVNFLALKTKNTRQHVPSPERHRFEEIKSTANQWLAALPSTSRIQTLGNDASKAH